MPMGVPPRRLCSFGEVGNAILEGAPMRFVYLLILLLALAAIVIFAVQNNQTVTLQYVNWSITCPLPLLIGLVYLLGMVSGWTVIGLLRRSLRRVAERPEN